MDFDIDIQTLNKIQDSEKIQNRMIERIIRRQEKTNKFSKYSKYELWFCYTWKIYTNW
mgnify:CR=1 FL=1